MAKKQEVQKEEVKGPSTEELLRVIADLQALLKAKDVDAVNAKTVEEKKPNQPKSITIQHIGRQRQWTVPGHQVLKAYRNTAVVDHPSFKKNIVLLPGCVIDATPELAKTLIDSRDFQKYGVESLK